MTIGEYFTVFAAMLVGLAVADVALSLHRLIRAGRSIKWDWITPVMAVVMISYILNLWWGLYFVYADLEKINFGWFMLDVSTLLILFLMAAAVLPDEKLPAGASLRDFYWDNCTHFWTMHGIYMVLIVIKNIQILRQIGTAEMADYFAVSAPQAATALISFLLVRFRKIWFHLLMIASIIYTVTTQWFAYTLN